MNFSRVWLQVILIILLCGLVTFLLFYNLDKAPLERWDEQTNANVVIDSLNSKEPWILRLGKDPFFEKPPFWYYATEGTVSIFGTNNFSFRLITALSGLGIAFLVFFVARQSYGLKAACLSVLTLIAIPQLFITNPAGYFSSHTLRSADLDSLQIVLILLALLFFLKVGSNKSFIYLIYTALAAAFLVKGPFVLIPLALLSMHFWLGRKSLGLSMRKLILAFLLFLSVVLSWHLLMWWYFGNTFISNYLNYHLFQRTLTPLEGHNEPFWFYFGLIIDFRINPLWPAMLAAVIYYFRKYPQRFALQFSLWMGILPLLLFTLVQTKLAWYILIGYPFLSILTGVFLAKVIATRRWKLILPLLMIFIIMCGYGIMQNLAYVWSL